MLYLSLFSIILILLICFYIKKLLIDFNYQSSEFFYFLIVSLFLNISVFLIFNKISLKLYILNLLINNEFNQLLLFFFIIIIINIIIWYLILSKASTKIYLQIPIILFYLIIYTHSIYILWFIWTEINFDEFLRNFYLLFIFILLNISLQLFIVWNITYLDISYPQIKYSKTYLMLLYFIITLMLFFISLKNKIVFLLKILGPISILIYFILEYNLDIQIYEIYVTYFSLYIQIYIKITLIFIYILISLSLSLSLYDKMYDKIELNRIYIKISWLKKKEFKIYLIILFVVMLILMLLFYFLGNFFYMNFNLYNFGLILDLFTFIFSNLIKLFIFTLKFIWTSLNFILAFWYILYYDLLIYNLNLYR